MSYHLFQPYLQLVHRLLENDVFLKVSSYKLITSRVTTSLGECPFRGHGGRCAPRGEEFQKAVINGQVTPEQVRKNNTSNKRDLSRGIERQEWFATAVGDSHPFPRMHGIYALVYADEFHAN